MLLTLSYSLWAWEALEYYSEVYCGRELDKVNAKYGSYDIKYKQQIQYKVVSYRADCQERYLETFTEQVLSLSSLKHLKDTVLRY